MAKQVSDLQVNQRETRIAGGKVPRHNEGTGQAPVPGGRMRLGGRRRIARRKKGFRISDHSREQAAQLWHRRIATCRKFSAM